MQNASLLMALSKSDGGGGNGGGGKDNKWRCKPKNLYSNCRKLVAHKAVCCYTLAANKQSGLHGTIKLLSSHGAQDITKVVGY
jgi:hypothetical protein